jgi:HlyD family secretion protein
MNWKKQKYLFLILLILILITLPWWCKKDKTPKVLAEKAQLGNIVEVVDEQGKIFPTEEQRINVALGAIVNELFVKDGDTITKGAAIANVTIESTSMTNASTATTPVPKSLDPATIAALISSSQQPKAAPQVKQITKTITIYAPTSGVISELGAKKGDRINSGYLGKISKANSWEVRADIGEMDIVKIREGQQVKIKIDAIPNDTLTGYVYSITNNQANGNIAGGLLGANDATTYKVYIKVNNEALTQLLKNKTYTLRSGMNVSVKIATQEKNNVLTIPLKALTTRYQNSTEMANQKVKAEIVAFVFNNNKAEKRIVTVGIQDFENIEILSGIKENELIITAPFEAIEKTLDNNTKVKKVNSLDN